MVNSLCFLQREFFANKQEAIWKTERGNLYDSDFKTAKRTNEDRSSS